jgi:hypothetical protein
MLTVAPTLSPFPFLWLQLHLLSHNFILPGNPFKDSSVSMGQATGWPAWVRLPAEKRKLSLVRSVQTFLGPIQPPIQWLLGALFPGVEWPQRDADHSSPPSVGVNNGVATVPPPYVLIKHREKFYFFIPAKDKHLWPYTRTTIVASSFFVHSPEPSGCYGKLYKTVLSYNY